MIIISPNDTVNYYEKTAQACIEIALPKRRAIEFCILLNSTILSVHRINEKKSHLLDQENHSYRQLLPLK